MADTVCNPMFVIRTRIQTEALHVIEGGGQMTGIRKTVKSLYSEGGVRVFWSGLSASLMGLSHVAIQFPVYEWLKAQARAKNHNRNKKSQEGALDLFLASGMSKVIASSLTYPHEVVRSRMMDARAETKRRSLIGTVRNIIEKEGALSLYSGLPVTLVRVVPNCCITFVTYELILRWAKENIALKS
eukprot:CAMPEP_0172522686 /NCGR_PEP_ID=MMETSP1066-20121228/293261_1 /TAXON_ID=671091 /ORGANISM="Coscinodiscus wailesii, Strain CCMP2513" /LENGTH=185 /DNA_ID=CAMNT_0013305715 /DNA_START=580 /DNA_END=1137 /DNA_ORIENTATION=+